MDPNRHRFLIANGLCLATVAVLLALGGLLPDQTATTGEPPRAVFTFDRGGLLRFNNGKVDVESVVPYSLEGGATQLPAVLGPWVGTDFPLNLAAYTAVEPELLINRLYRNPKGEQVTFTVVGSTTSRKLHRPEICYRAGGWEVTELPVHPVALGSGELGASAFLARDDLLHDQRVGLAWYLWRDGRRRIEDGAFVMHVTAPVSNGHVEAAFTAAEQFMQQLFRQTVEAPPRLLSLHVGR